MQFVYLYILRTLHIGPPSGSDFDEIKNYLLKFELDNRYLEPTEFLMAKTVSNELVGFGRIRHYDHCDELCSLGVIEHMRLKGLGKKLIANLIETSSQPLYLVCIIPEFFEPLGFKIVSQYPHELHEKLLYCTSELVVPEKYVVMKYFLS